jgi:hypothetical protein
MKAQRKAILVAAVAMLGFLNACEKITGEDNDRDCRIIKITATASPGNNVHSLTYNNEGKISTYNITGSTPTSKVYNYIGNNIIINNSVPGETWRDSIVVNDRGNILYLRRYSPSNTDYTDNTFFYSGEELTRVEQRTSGNAIPRVIMYTYENGNPVREESLSGTIIMEFYENEEVQQGDYLVLSGLTLYGVILYPQKNLIKTLSMGSFVANFSYEKDSDGLIKQLTATVGGEVTTLAYEYECD